MESSIKITSSEGSDVKNLKNSNKPKGPYGIIHVILGVMILFLSVGFLGSLSSKNITTNNEPTKIPEQNLVKPTKEYAGKILTLSDFENSPFCKDYVCKEDDSWPLNTGGINHTYASIPLGGDKHNYLGIEISTEDNKTTEFGIMFFGREVSGLTQNDLEIVYKFIKSIDSTQDSSSLKNYISKNVEKEINQIHEATPLSWGSFVVYAGKIGQQTISIESK